MRVIVVGAGIGGLTLALGLRQAGIDVAVYERDPVDRRRQGISLHVDDRGLTALRGCLPPALMAMVEATAGRPRVQAQVLAEVAGELTLARTEPLTAATSKARPGRQVDRPLLRAVLLHGLEGAVRFEAPFTRFRTRDDGTVQAWFGDGSTDTADVLVGADGVGSAVRRQHLPQALVLDSGRRMLMGAAPLRAAAETGLLALIGDNPTSATAGRMLALGVLRHTVRPAVARDRWLPGLQSPAVSDAQDYVMWALSLTDRELGSAAAPYELWDRARSLSRDLPEPLKLIIDEARPEATIALRIAQIPPLPAFPDGPVTVIGDAVHAAPGFGGNLAMQDAHRLRDALVRVDRGQQSLIPALSDFNDHLRQVDRPASGQRPLDETRGR